MSWLQVFVIGGLALGIMVFCASYLSAAHEPQRKACIEAGHTWNKIEYLCVANLKK